jgi:hypothetical protein
MSGMLAPENARRGLAACAELDQLQGYALQRSEQRVKDHLNGVDEDKGFCRRVNRLSLLVSSKKQLSSLRSTRCCQGRLQQRESRRQLSQVHTPDDMGCDLAVCSVLNYIAGGLSP